MTATDAGGLTLRVDVTSPVPVYEQLREQVTALVGARQLVRGDRLPAARALAADLGLAVGTVARAYKELEATGVVVSRRRTGTVVAGRSTDVMTPPPSSSPTPPPTWSGSAGRRAGPTSSCSRPCAPPSSTGGRSAAVADQAGGVDRHRHRAGVVQHRREHR